MQISPKHTLTTEYCSITRTASRIEKLYPNLPSEHIGITFADMDGTLPIEEQCHGILVHIAQYKSFNELISDISNTYLLQRFHQNDYGVSWILCEHLGWFNRLAVSWSWFSQHAMGIYIQDLKEDYIIPPAAYGLVPETRWIIVDPSKIYGVGILCNDPRLQVVIDDCPQLLRVLQQVHLLELKEPHEVVPPDFVMQRIYQWNGRWMKPITQNKVYAQMHDQGTNYEYLLAPFIKSL